MKKQTRIFTCLSALLLLCCACSAGTGEEPTIPETPNSGNHAMEDNSGTDGADVAAPSENAIGADGSGPIVYMTTDISSAGLMAIYEALDWTPGDKVAVKLSTGEPGSNYLRTDLIGELVQSLENPTIVECNTAYGGSRSSTAMHYQVAEDHGYTEIAAVDIMDEEGSVKDPPIR